MAMALWNPLRAAANPAPRSAAVRAVGWIANWSSKGLSNVRSMRSQRRRLSVPVFDHDARWDLPLIEDAVTARLTSSAARGVGDPVLTRNRGEPMQSVRINPVRGPQHANAAYPTLGRVSLGEARRSHRRRSLVGLKVSSRTSKSPALSTIEIPPDFDARVYIPSDPVSKG